MWDVLLRMYVTAALVLHPLIVGDGLLKYLNAILIAECKVQQ